MSNSHQPEISKASVVLFNVKYSANLGDGVLSECLEGGLVNYGFASDKVRSADLAARTKFSVNSAGRGRLLSLLDGMPKNLRQSLLMIPLRYLLKSKWSPFYGRNLNVADVVVVGGGNLFTDMDRNFPTKISAVMRLAAKRNLPLAIYGVGASGVWSDASIREMRKALEACRPFYISVRDEQSKSTFESLFADSIGCQVAVVRDPGILASRHYVSRQLSNSQVSGASRKKIGLCVTAGSALRYHSDLTLDDEKLRDLYQECAVGLIEKGFDIALFTNGSSEDRSFLENELSHLKTKYPSHVQIQQADTPDQLVSIISSLDALVAHRMHALIVAFSYNIPIAALSWDPKIRAFMDSVGMSSATLDTAHTSSVEIINNVVQLLSTNSVPDNSAFIDESTEHINLLGQAIEQALAKKLGR
ncbi:MAG: polysaccharide pyruvyl transferase family protein [Pseudomonadota bacterium]